MVGDAGLIKGLHWTSIFTQELQVRAAYLYNHVEEVDGKQWKAFDLAIDLMSRGIVDLEWMVTHQYPLAEYKRAFELTSSRNKNQSIKIAFKFED